MLVCDTKDHLPAAVFCCLPLLLFLLACPSRGPWREFPEEDPLWCGPNRHVTREARSVEFVTAGGEVRWRVSDGEYLTPKVVAEKGIQYLEDTGVIKKITGYGSSFSYDFGEYSGSDVILVSVEPSVFVIAEAPLDAKRKWYENRRILLIGSDQERGVEYGTRIPPAENLYWFSPELESGVQPVAPSNGNTMEVKLPNGRLLFSKAAGIWEVSRL